MDLDLDKSKSASIKSLQEIGNPKPITGHKLSLRTERESDELLFNSNSFLETLPKKIGTSNSMLQLHKFFNGYQRFHKTYFSENRNLYEELQRGQAPKTVLVGCCDSRVDPAIITDCDPGDIFVIRNVANLVPPYSPDPGHHGTSAALEYAVKVLKVENIIVLGHSHCGGIKSLVEQPKESFEFLESWMSIAQKSKERVAKHYNDTFPASVRERACEQASILESLEHLISYPWIVQKLKEETLTINGWYFDFDTGDLLAYNTELSKFEAIQKGIPSIQTPSKIKQFSFSKKNSSREFSIKETPLEHQNIPLMSTANETTVSL